MFRQKDKKLSCALPCSAAVPRSSHVVKLEDRLGDGGVAGAPPGFGLLQCSVLPLRWLASRV